MKKIFITSALAITTLGVVFAEEATTTKAMPSKQDVRTHIKMEVRGQNASGTKPAMSSGDAQIDAQVKALRLEMEAKIKAIHEDYNARIKLLIESKKPIIVHPDGSTSTVKEVRKDIIETKKEAKQNMKQEMRVKASTTKPVSEFLNKFRGYFGASVQAEAQ